MRILLIVILLSFMTGCLSSFKVTGYSGRTVIINCEYSIEERSHEKYLCMGEYSWSCEDIIRTGLKNTWQHSGRFSLYDNTEGNYFKVIIRQLTKQDEGTYWCGVDIPNAPDSYTKVELDVKKATTTTTTTTATATAPPTPATTTTTAAPATTTFTSPSSSSPPSSLNGSGSVSSTLRVSPDKGNNEGGCHGDGDYEEIKERPLQSDSDAAPTTIYATANLPTSHSDSPHYASINFHKNPSGPNEARVTITKEGSCRNEATVAIDKEGTSSCDYATVNFGQSPAYSTVNHPHSSSEARI
ncbi:unnamed protein product [Coregonus sp. 'balchen']|nr:unnamed protein product [Coregonus sp. 'balchen']